ncbi:MAG: tyrosine--tRNA ligase [Chloroflexi bacterium]|nr:tyrosine--tRNA ligase [Chloroflexota bacterium]
MSKADQDIERILGRGVAEVIVREELIRLLKTSPRPLRIKYGVDPSRPGLHLGHVVCFRKLRQLQDLGHRVIVIMGDWTAQIGDPSGQSATRTMLTAEEVKTNAQTYLDQFFKVVDLKKTEVVWQSTWFEKFTLKDVIDLASRYTVARMLERDDFAKRYAQGIPIAITEFLYPLLQAYDSIAIGADVEMGGTDQTFNFLVAREIQRELGQAPQQVITVPLLVGTDGQIKMSKSVGNTIDVLDPPDQMYGKIMSLPDAVMMDYFWLLTDVPEDELQDTRQDMKTGKANPRDIKMRLAREIISQFYSVEEVQKAEEEFIRIFSAREWPEEMPEFKLEEGGSRKVVDVMEASGLVPTRSEARRLIRQGGVRLDGQKVDDLNLEIPWKETVLQVGRRKFLRIIPG